MSATSSTFHTFQTNIGDLTSVSEVSPDVFRGKIVVLVLIASDSCFSILPFHGGRTGTLMLPHQYLGNIGRVVA